MFDSKEIKRLRLESGLPDTLPVNTYNLIIGGVLLYGFIVNALIVWFCEPYFSSINPLIFIIGYFVSGFAGIFIARSDSPVISFIGYNLVVVPIGTLLSICLPSYEFDTILAAIIVTGIVVACMMSLSVTYPKFFSSLGTTLFISLITGMLVQIIAVVLGYSGNLFNWLFVVIFSLYVGYDWYRAQMYPKTLDNAVDSALDIYLDIINLFLRILRILGSKNRK